MFNKIIYIFALELILPSASYAYLDPGSGSILIQMFLVFLASIAAFYSKIKFQIFKFIKKFKKIKK